MPAIDPAQLERDYVELQRQNHHLRAENHRLVEELDQAVRRAATWRRVAQWIWEASQADS